VTTAPDRRGSVAAIVLAGGRAARFGTDKLTAELDGEQLLGWAIAAVALVADDVIVAGRSMTPTSRVPVRSSGDRTPFAGPLAGLADALELVRAERAIVIGGDMPAVVPEVLAAMLDRLGVGPHVEAVILGGPTGADVAPIPRQVLPLAIEVDAARAAARAALADGERSLGRFLDRLPHAELPADTWRVLDPDGKSLLDVDTRADLERIGARRLR
jgi:molybdopterin-guanine dinucleotide biosynthesis protein A